VLTKKQIYEHAESAAFDIQDLLESEGFTVDGGKIMEIADGLNTLIEGVIGEEDWKKVVEHSQFQAVKEELERKDDKTKTEENPEGSREEA